MIRISSSRTTCSREIQSIEETVGAGHSLLETRIIEIPVLYNDPWTRETLMRFRDRHQTPDKTDIEYTAAINHLDGVDGFVKAHSGAPWFVSMVGFVAGLPFLYQMVDRPRSKFNRRNICGPHRYAQADDRPRRLFRLHLFSARRRRLSDVRHHADADLRSQSTDQISQGLHVPVQSGRHRQVAADRARRNTTKSSPTSTRASSRRKWPK